MSTKINILFTILFILINFQGDSQVFTSEELDLTDRDPDQVSVLSGNILSRPVPTEYGYVATGGGKSIYAFTQDGKLLWQKPLKQRPGELISTGAEDMIYTVSAGRILNMVNASGILLWSTDCQFTVTAPPIEGTDGRIWVFGNNQVSCYGTKGIRRWTLGTGPQDTSAPKAEFPDGSMIIPLNGAGIHAIRISPFGQEMEAPQLESSIKDAAKTPWGTALLLSCGKLRMYRAENGSTEPSWTATDEFPAPDFLIPSPDGDRLCIIQSAPVRITVVNARTGKTESSFTTGTESPVQNPSWTAQGIVIHSQGKTSCHGEDGSTIWRASYQSKRNWNHVFATDGGTLCFSTDDWVLEGYRMKSASGARRERKFKDTGMLESYGEKPPTCSTDLGHPYIDSSMSGKMSQRFAEGDFGPEESDWIPVIQNEYETMFREWTEKSWQESLDYSVFKNELQYDGQILALMGNSGIFFDSTKILTMAKYVKDPTILLFIVEYMGRSAWDPGGKFLDALEFIVTKRATPADTTLLAAAADSTRAVCHFMGKPLFIEKGKRILMFMVSPQFRPQTKEKAVSTLRKIMDEGL